MVCDEWRARVALFHPETNGIRRVSRRAPLRVSARHVTRHTLALVSPRPSSAFSPSFTVPRRPIHLEHGHQPRWELVFGVVFVAELVCVIVFIRVGVRVGGPSLRRRARHLRLERDNLIPQRASLRLRFLRDGRPRRLDDAKTIFERAPSRPAGRHGRARARRRARNFSRSAADRAASAPPRRRAKGHDFHPRARPRAPRPWTPSLSPRRRRRPPADLKATARAATAASSRASRAPRRDVACTSRVPRLPRVCLDLHPRHVTARRRIPRRCQRILFFRRRPRARLFAREILFA